LKQWETDKSRKLHRNIDNNDGPIGFVQNHLTPLQLVIFNMYALVLYFTIHLFLFYIITF
jgi:hypothetical protein